MFGQINIFNKLDSVIFKSPLFYCELVISITKSLAVILCSYSHKSILYLR